MTVPVLMVLFRKEKARVVSEVTTKVEDHVPTWLLLGTIVLLIVASQFPNKPELTNGYICCGLAVVGILYECLRQKKSGVAMEVIRSIDYKTLLLLTD